MAGYYGLENKEVIRIKVKVSNKKSFILFCYNNSFAYLFL